ncbi:isochorismate synthase [Nocardiopsis flavescens]|uniref:isochorismate synthase n=1 Tax=Nocardiopsis flavescens TaxID=758803 RepID=A0A1M6J778_9ACTN|nr:isochorismate synthase [Nocardiopsis flavescens]SHJ42539.1 isochorismate synthase [Nocardiopsis flavescens]
MPQRAETPAANAGDLLAAYRPGDSFLSSPDGVLHGSGALAVLDRADALSDALADAGPGALALGAVPFDATRPAHLVVPRTVRTAPPLREGAADLAWRALRGAWTLTPDPAPDEHTAAVGRAVKLMAEQPDLRKVVLARRLRLQGDRDIDIPTVLGNLLRRDPDAHVFAVGLPERGAGPRTLIGASPELLVSRRGRDVLSNPLAGSAPRSADPTKDQVNAVGLLTSAKDRHEHAVVVEAVADALAPHCSDLAVPAEPELARTAALWHLSTRITGRLRDPDTPAHALAAALHPTPAVCGTPTGRAFDTIGALEPFDRGFYTGAVGHSDARGDGTWVVTIRCADVTGPDLDLFAGGGIMPESDPEAELAETSAKLRTLLLALGIDRTA